MTTPITKKNLRETALTCRLHIPSEIRVAAQQAILRETLAYIPTRKNSVIAGYWPIKGEVDPRPLLLKTIRLGCRAALPQVVEFQKPLIFRAWQEGVPMIGGRYGIQEPDPARCPSLVPDIILTPMLAFDGRGHRLGYGSGFYDRTFDSLCEMGHPFLAVGLAFEAQKLDEIPATPNDVPMDMIVTEKKVYRFERRTT